MWLIVLYQLTAQIQQETISYMNLSSLKKMAEGIKIVDDNLAEEVLRRQDMIQVPSPGQISTEVYPLGSQFPQPQS